MQRVDDFSIGDRVRHPNGAIGTVVAFGQAGSCKDVCVHVEFDPVPRNGQKWPPPRRKWRGAYPNSWFTEKNVLRVTAKRVGLDVFESVTL